jgi:hypothetical protein
LSPERVYPIDFCDGEARAVSVGASNNAGIVPVSSSCSKGEKLVLNTGERRKGRRLTLTKMSIG